MMTTPDGTSIHAPSGRTLASGARPAVRGQVRTAAGVLAWALAIALAAQMRIPVPGTDVPMTLQVLAALLTGYFSSPRAAAAATVLYLALGTVGFPVFAHTAGLWGPTGGYLIGFVAAAWLVSRLRGGPEAGRLRLAAAGAAGVTARFLFGLAWRLAWFGGNVPAVVATGVWPFALKAMVEVAFAATLARLWHAGNDRFRSAEPPTGPRAASV